MQPQNQSNDGHIVVQPPTPAAPPVPPANPVSPVAPAAPAPAPIPVPTPSLAPAQPVSSVLAPTPVQAAPEPPQAFGSGPATSSAGPTAPVSATPVDEQTSYDDDEEYEDDQEGDGDDENLSQPVNWQAQEFIHQDKNKTWYIAFGVIVAVLMAVSILLMKSWTFAVLLVVISAVIVVFAKRPPRTMSYSLSDKGLHVGDTLHSFSEFKAFGVIHDGLEYSVMLIPTKRFMPGVSVYFPEESGEDIVDMLGSRLPMQELHLDMIDRLVRALRL